MAYEDLRVAPRRLANRGVHQAPRGDLIDIVHPTEAGATPGAIPTVGWNIERRSWQERCARVADARAWATAERPSVLFDLATARLIEAKMLSWPTARAVGVAFLR